MKYCQAVNTGKDFFTHEDTASAHLSGHPGDIWAVGDDNSEWIGRASGTEKTLEEATAIVLAASQSGWDDSNLDGETAEQKVERIGARPTTVTLPA
jgi:hypothetical protein